MAKQRYVNTRFWSDNYISELKPLQRYLFLYFLTNEHTNIGGIYELPIRTIAFETDLPQKTIFEALERFKNDGKVFYIDGWVYVKNFSKHQSVNEKTKIGIENSLKEVAPNVLAQVKEIDMGSDTQSMEYELSKLKSKSKLKSTTMSEKSDASIHFHQFWDAYPKKELKKKSQEIWKRKGLDSALPEILTFLEKAKKTDRWIKGFVKQPTTFLTNESWNDDLGAYGDAKSPPEKSTMTHYRDFSKDPLV